MRITNTYFGPKKYQDLPQADNTSTGTVIQPCKLQRLSPNAKIVIGIHEVRCLIYQKFIGPNILSSVPNGLVAQLSVFGWILYGSVLYRSIVCSVRKSSVTSHRLLYFERVSQEFLHRFWDLDSIGICDKDSSVTHSVLDRFNESLKSEEGSYTGLLPWINHVSKVVE